MDKDKRIQFGDAILNRAASESNPRRVGYYVETVRRKGRVVNPGTYLRLTDKRGDFWEHGATNGHLVLMTDQPTEHPDTPRLRAIGRALYCMDHRELDRWLDDVKIAQTGEVYSYDLDSLRAALDKLTEVEDD